MMTEMLVPPGHVKRTDTGYLISTVRSLNRRQRFFNVAMLVGLVCIAVAALLLFQRSTAQEEAIVQLIDSLKHTCEQADQGSLPADTRNDCARVEQGQVPRVVEGIPGRTGATGPAGSAGPPGESPPCLHTPAMCQGRDGVDGTPGTPGRDGVNGQSPPCLSSPSMCQGANGTNGEPPLGWSTTRADGSTETCERAPAFDPASPRYSCTTTTPPKDN